LIDFIACEKHLSAINGFHGPLLLVLKALSQWEDNETCEDLFPIWGEAVVAVVNPLGV